jgi:hypothetical protein
MTTAKIYLKLLHQKAQASSFDITTKNYKDFLSQHTKQNKLAQFKHRMRGITNQIEKLKPCLKVIGTVTTQLP